jgi:hypothetical protein
MHSVKNRFLMRVKNLTPGVWNACRWNTVVRDLLVIGGCIATEPTSLPAFFHFFRLLPSMLRQRRLIAQRRRANDRYLTMWFAGNQKHAGQVFVPAPVTEIAARRS